jgi:hypothetical protein
MLSAIVMRRLEPAPFCIERPYFNLLTLISINPERVKSNSDRCSPSNMGTTQKIALKGRDSIIARLIKPDISCGFKRS